MKAVLAVPTLLALGLLGAAADALTAPDVELTRPAAGDVLVAGSDAVVEWTLDGTALDPGVEEWEAFLSVNGGDFYAVRLTPHLDASRRRFTFKVPALATAQARILLRFGDEEHEVGVESPQRFAIRLPAHPVAVRERMAPDRGEPARPGEPGVVAWMEGSRQGDDLALVRSSLPPAAGPVVADGHTRPLALLTSRSDSPALTPRENRTPTRTTHADVTTAARVRPPAPILLLGCRQNE